MGKKNKLKAVLRAAIERSFSDTLVNENGTQMIEETRVKALIIEKKIETLKAIL